MLIHKVEKTGESQTYCGVNSPKYTTIDDGLVTCSKCKKVIFYKNALGASRVVPNVKVNFPFPIITRKK